MNRRKEILEELTDAAPILAEVEIQHPYRVPPGYFDSLPALILLRIKTENAGSAQEELDIISPLLGGLSKKMPFSAPEGYFESLKPSMGEAQIQPAPARVVRMFQPHKSFRMAAAAIVVGIIGIAGWLFFQEPAEKQYAMKPDAEMQKEFQTKVDGLSENELANFVEATTVITSYDNAGTGEINEDDVKLMLADIPDQELEKFIDQGSVKEKFN